MPDMLVPLYRLPPVEPRANKLAEHNITLRAAMPYERSLVLAFIEDTFSTAWADEAATTFAHHPVRTIIAHQDQTILGFACHDATTRAFFGPTGVHPDHQRKGIGAALLIAALHAMQQRGYAYAIIGAAGPTDFYQRTVNAIPIPDSTPGIYKHKLNP